MRILVVEDEALAAEHLMARVRVRLPQAELPSPIASVQALDRWLQTHAAPDLIFADIELQDGRVFQSVELARTDAPVIFVTAYEQFLLDAFKAQGVAYLLKPLDDALLAQALEKVARLQRAFAPRLDLAAIAQAMASPVRHRQRFNVRLAEGIALLAVERVALIELHDGMLRLIDQQGRTHPAAHAESLNELQQQLDPARFFRINRTQIVNVDAIAQVIPHKDTLLLALKASNLSCRVSVHRVPDFRRWAG